MKKSIFALSLILCAAMLLAGCGSAAPAETTQGTAATSAAPETTAALTPAEIRAALSDDLPDKKFDGRKFTVITENSFTTFYVVEELNGETLNDAVYERNSRLSERFNVTINGLFTSGYKESGTTIANAVKAGDSTAFDVVAHHMVNNGSLALSGYYQNWYDVPYIDFERPWWAPSNREDLSVNGKAFLVVGDMCLSAIPRTWAYIYNKSLWEDLKLENPYELVNSGKWTINKVEEIVKVGYSDLNGDGTVNVGDRYGFVTNLSSASNTYVWAFDNPIITKYTNGKAVISFYSDRYVTMMQKLVHFLNDNPIYASSGNDWNSHFEKVFDVGMSVLSASQISHVATAAGDVDFAMGVLPYPKFDEAQDGYHTMVDGSGESMGMPVTTKDLEFAGIMTEAICAENYKNVIPAYYEIVFKMRYADMREDAEMMDIVLDGRYFDIGYLYDNWKGASFWAQTLVNNNDDNVASYYASKWPAVEQYYNTVLALFN